VIKTVQVVFSSDQSYFCVPEVARDGGLWLSVKTYPLPLSEMWRFPNTFGMAVMRGRDYARMFTRNPLREGKTEPVPADDPLVADWHDASWWTPGLEEAWAECEGLREALATAQASTEAEPKKNSKDRDSSRGSHARE
jgi:hypothetical protein